MPEFQDRNISNTSSWPKIGIGDVEMLIYSWVVYAGVCQMINIFGIVTNIINIICFAKQGFRDPVNISLMGLSISDLASITSLALTFFIVPCSVSSTVLPFEILDITYVVSVTPHFAFTRVSSCITAMITFERCLSIAAPLKIKSIVTPKRTAVIIVAIFVTFTFSAAPMFYTSRLGTYFSARRNRTMYGFVYRDPREHIERITVLINNFIVPFGAFIIIVICTVILSVQLRLKSKWRKNNITSVQAERVSNRNQKIGTMVVLISVLYIVCFVPSSITLLVVSFEPAFFINGQYANISVAFFGIVYALEGINSAVNIFIYHHMSSKYRDTFTTIFRHIKQ